MMLRIFYLSLGFLLIFGGLLNADNVVILPSSDLPNNTSSQNSPFIGTQSSTATIQKFSVKSKNITPNIAPLAKNAKIITMSFVGDIILGDYLGAEGATFDAKYIEVKKNPRYFGGGVADILQKDDLSIGNLDGVLSDSIITPTKDKPFIFKGRESYAKILRFAGIDLVNLANNHINDYGEQGFNDTINALKKARVRFFGEENLVLLRIKGVKFGFAGEKGWNLWAKNNVERDIKKLREMGAEVVIFSFHFGKEKSNTPSAIQRELAHFAIDCGADLIIAHHTHTLQGFEEYKGKKIAYSLANFIYGGSKLGGDKDSIIYQVRFVFSNDWQNKRNASLWCDECDNNFVANLKSIDTLGTNAIMIHHIIPISVSSSDLLNDYRPQIYSKNSDGFIRIMNRLNTYSETIEGQK